MRYNAPGVPGLWLAVVLSARVPVELQGQRRGFHADYSA